MYNGQDVFIIVSIYTCVCFTMADTLSDHLVEFWNTLDQLTKDPTQSPGSIETALTVVLQRSGITPQDIATITKPIQQWNPTAIPLAQQPILPAPAPAGGAPAGGAPAPVIPAPAPVIVPLDKAVILALFKDAFDTFVTEIMNGIPGRAPGLQDDIDLFKTIHDNVQKTNYFEKECQTQLDDTFGTTTLLTNGRYKFNDDYQQNILTLLKNVVVPSIKTKYTAFLETEYNTLVNNLIVVKSKDQKSFLETIGIGQIRYNNFMVATNEFIKAAQDVLNNNTFDTIFDDTKPNNIPVTQITMQEFILNAWTELLNNRNIDNFPLVDDFKKKFTTVSQNFTECQNLKLKDQIQKDWVDTFDLKNLQGTVKAYYDNRTNVDDIQTFVEKHHLITTKTDKQDELALALENYSEYNISQIAKTTGQNIQDFISTKIKEITNTQNSLLNLVTDDEVIKAIDIKLVGIIKLLTDSKFLFKNNTINEKLLSMEINWFTFIKSLPFKKILNDANSVHQSILLKVKGFYTHLEFYYSVRMNILLQYLPNKDLIAQYTSEFYETIGELMNTLVQLLTKTKFKTSFDYNPQELMVLTGASNKKSGLLYYQSTQVQNDITKELNKLMSNYIIQNQKQLETTNQPQLKENDSLYIKHAFLAYFQLDRSSYTDNADLMEPKESIFNYYPSDPMTFSLRGFWDGSSWDDILDENMLYPLAIWSSEQPLIMTKAAIDNFIQTNSTAKLTVTPIQLIKSEMMTTDSSMDEALLLLNQTINQPDKTENVANNWNFW